MADFRGLARALGGAAGGLRRGLETNEERRRFEQVRKDREAARGLDLILQQAAYWQREETNKRNKFESDRVFRAGQEKETTRATEFGRTQTRLEDIFKEVQKAQVDISQQRADIAQQEANRRGAGGRFGDIGKTILDLAAFDRIGAAKEKSKAAFEEKQKELPAVNFQRDAQGEIITDENDEPIQIPNPDKTAPWPGQFQTSADSLEALRRSSVKHNVPQEMIAENWDINDAWSDLFHRSKRAAPVGGAAGIPQFPVSRGILGIALSRAAGSQAGQQGLLQQPISGNTAGLGLSGLLSGGQQDQQQGPPVPPNDGSFTPEEYAAFTQRWYSERLWEQLQ